MDAVWEVVVFASKAFLIVSSVLAVSVVMLNLSLRFKPPREQLEVENLNDRLQAFADALKDAGSDAKSRKAEAKSRKKEKKAEQTMLTSRKKVYVLDFDGDLRASAVEHFRDEITAVLAAAQTDRDEVVVRLESAGGMVQGYGLAAAQLMRLRDRNLNLTVCVDQVAASGGYLMACTAHQILAAPFAVVGSIGVIAQVPNLHRFLKKHDVDYEEITAGDFKRTVSLFAEITPKGRSKFTEQIEDTHSLFKEFVHNLRPQLNMTQIATGEHWFGHRALELGLIDKIQSSDDYLFEQMTAQKAQVLHVRVQIRKSLSERIAFASAQLMNRTLESVSDRLARLG